MKSAERASFAPSSDRSVSDRRLAGALHEVSNALTVVLGWLADARDLARNAPGSIAAGSAGPGSIAAGSGEGRSLSALGDLSFDDLAGLAEDNPRRLLDGALSVALEHARRAHTVARRAIGAQVDPEDGVRSAAAVVEDAVLATSHEANVRDVEVVLREPFADAMVDEPEAVLRVLINLLLNALSFSPLGGRIEVSLEAVDDRVCFGVRDEGPGVAPELKAGLFSSGESQRQGGAGIGLMHSFGLANEHGGELRLVDSPRGAHFELSWKVAEAPSQVLPSRVPSVRPPASIAAALASLAPPPLEAVQPEERQGDDRISAPPTVPSHSVPPPPSLRRSFAGKRLLLLEDDDAVLEMVRFGLTARGADVLVASTARALDELLEDARGYDAALLDLSPLGSNPGAVLQRLSGLRVPVVLISGSVTPNIGDLPFASWVHKPFALNELYEALLALDSID